MSNPKEEIEKLQEGCYKYWGEDDEMICLGTEGTCNFHELCPTCQAKLETWKVALTQVQEIIENERIYPDYKGLSVEEALTQFKIKIIKELKGALE